MSRLFGVGLAVCILGFGGFYFIVNPSYQKSFQARFEYFLGDYEKAFNYSDEALKLDRYNKMAFSIFVKSSVALKYKKYIKDGLDYLSKMETISQKKIITKSDKSRIKFMCEIMIESYKNLQSSKLTDEELKLSAQDINEKFLKIYSELF